MTEDVEFLNRWKKGIFHRGEFEKYLKVMPRGDLECIFFMNENKEKGVPELVQNIMIMDGIGKLLEKNEKKTVKVKGLIDRYKKQRNKNILENLKIGFFGKNENKQTLTKPESEDMKKQLDELYRIIHERDSKYLGDWEHTHRSNLDKAKDTEKID